jgi:hypothetical protein
MHVKIAGKVNHPDFRFKLKKDEYLLFVESAESDVPAGHTFTYYKHKKENKWLEGSMTLVYVVQQSAKDFDGIPKGHESICIFHMPDGETILKNVPAGEGWNRIGLVFSDEVMA